MSTKPKVEVPKGKPPSRLKIRDVVKGKGPGAEPSDNLTVQYVGVRYSNGEEFDASWDRGEPFSFALGQGEVIPGWDAGLDGMKEGGRRELIIPASKAYGPSGQPPDIGPNETLVFVIDLKKIG
ncbi:MAG: FKBP-type peptidyl-prolyl cis-trans isomerase [Solirubrobacteraceae bacterium]